MAIAATAAHGVPQPTDRESGLPNPFRRLAPRVAAELPVSLHGSGLPEGAAARTRDIGTAGLCLATSSTFAFRSLMRVVVELPTGRLELAAQGRWQREDADGVGVLTGVRFVDLTPDAWSSLWNVVQMRMKVIFAFLQEATQLPLDFDERMELTLFTRLRKHEAGRCISGGIEEESHSIFLIFSGQVVLQAEVQGRSETVARLCRGDSFGGLELFTPRPTREIAVAATGVQLLEIEAFTYRCLEATRPALARRIRELVLHSHLARLHGLLDR